MSEATTHAVRRALARADAGKALSLDEATALVRRREQQGTFKSGDDLKSAGIDAAKLEARKDRLAF